MKEHYSPADWYDDKIYDDDDDVDDDDDDDDGKLGFTRDDQKGVAREPPSLCPKYPQLCCDATFSYYLVSKVPNSRHFAQMH